MTSFRLKTLALQACLAGLAGLPALPAGAIEPQPSVSKPVLASQDAKSAAAAAARAAAKDNAQAVPGTASTGSGKADTSLNRAGPSLSGDRGKTDPLGAATAISSGRPGTDLPTDVTQKPGFAAGFAQKPQLGADAAVTGKPMGGLEGGSIGGPLGAAAAAGSASRGIAAQGKGAISAGESESCRKTGACPEQALKQEDKTFATQSGDRVTTFIDGSFTIENVAKGTHESYDKNNNCIGGACAGSMLPEEAGKPGKEEYLRGKLGDKNYQIVEAARAGATTNPDRNDGSTAVRNTDAAVPGASATGQSLFGQPVAGGVRAGGVPKTGVDFNGNSGAIDPGDESTVTAGNRQQDPGAVFDSAPTRDFPAGSAGGSQDDEEEDEEEDKKDGSAN